ncbi:hypothetical protein [Paenibacillus sp. AR247]|uniref:hypothetical protein n=1 Tax=Paenibacillus sp. AR247 TaxID=1631599 RepID=UPI0011B01ACE|nr:hypothetical protein [Paenibacillus sp. AR247]
MGTLSEDDAVDFFTDLFAKARNEHLGLIKALQTAVQDKMTEDIIMTAARNFIDHQGLKREFSEYLNRGLSEIGSDILGPVQ